MVRIPLFPPLKNPRHSFKKALCRGFSLCLYC
nr:MAG TPA: hypothetical protein [Caudoviricetes sp.]DAH19586.1 MAG TPA: hypothetical protein [Caudoviricetes sp.]DAH49192.1 MAG TPA: hypothetical protein [Caudoviricetes sp.]